MNVLINGEVMYGSEGRRIMRMGSLNLIVLYEEGGGKRSCGRYIDGVRRWDGRRERRWRLRGPKRMEEGVDGRGPKRKGCNVRRRERMGCGDSEDGDGRQEGGVAEGGWV
jgi:hypothetical protein